MMSAVRGPRLLVALAAAALAAGALMLVPGAMAVKGSPAHSAKAAPASAAPPADVLLHRGATTVALDPGTAAALESLGISVAPVKPASAGPEGISFPITFGVVDRDTLAGQVRHSGGLRFTQGDTTVVLSRFFIDSDETPTLSGLVGASRYTGDRADLFSLDLSGAQIATGKRSVKATGVTLRLTSDAADALNGAFGGGGTPFAEDLLIGTAKVAARVVVRSL